MPSGFLLCNGASVSKADYPALADVLGETGTTFSLPDYRDRVPQGAGTVSPNVGISASLPAIEGSLDIRGGEVTDTEEYLVFAMYPEGVFSVDETEGNSCANIASCYAKRHTSERTYFSASGYDSVYSGTAVQPSAWTAHFLIKA